MLKCLLLDAQTPNASSPQRCDISTRSRLHWPLPYIDLKQLVNTKTLDGSSTAYCAPSIHGYPWDQRSPDTSDECYSGMGSNCSEAGQQEKAGQQSNIAIITTATVLFAVIPLLSVGLTQS